MVEFDSDSVDGAVVGVARGQLTLEDMHEAVVSAWRLVEGPRIRLLWDLRDAQFDLSPNEVRELARFIKHQSPPGDIRTVFVVARDLEFGLVRMFEAFRETAGARTAVFRDKEQALAWLAIDAV